MRERARHAARRVAIDHKLDELVGSLSHGEHRQVAIAMSLASEPKLLMLDEPASGLSRGERQVLTDLLLGLDREITLILIEHDMDVALRVAECVTMMHDGRVIVEGTPDGDSGEHARARSLSGPRQLRGGVVATPLLEVSGLNAYYGSAQALHDVAFAMDRESVAIVGRNGMGKTTLCAAIMGLTPPRVSGSVRFDGVELAGKPAYKIARAGIGYVPQGRRLFPSLTVNEHLKIATRSGSNGGWSIERIYELFPRLAERKRNGGAELSGGEQQMLAIGRALLGDPKLLIMDEPSEGLAPAIVDSLVETFKSLSERRSGDPPHRAEARRRDLARRAPAHHGRRRDRARDDGRRAGTRLRDAAQVPRRRASRRLAS